MLPIWQQEKRVASKAWFIAVLKGSSEETLGIIGTKFLCSNSNLKSNLKIHKQFDLMAAADGAICQVVIIVI